MTYQTICALGPLPSSTLSNFSYNATLNCVLIIPMQVGYEAALIITDWEYEQSRHIRAKICGKVDFTILL